MNKGRKSGDNCNVSLNSVETMLLEAKKAYEAKPDNLRLFDKYIQLLIKNNFINEAKTLIAESSLLKQKCVESDLTHAYLVYKMKKYDEADAMFDELILKYPGNHKLRILYAHTLKKRRKLIKAYEVIKPIIVDNLDKKQQEIYNEIIKIISVIEKKEMRTLQDTDDFCILSMKHAILHFKEKSEKKHASKQFGKISLITGTLGPGGAERQLCLTAINLNQKMRSGEHVAGIQIDKEVDVLINIFDSDDKGFFLPLLKENNVNLLQVNKLPITAIENLLINSPVLFNLLNESPSPIRYGLNRLVHYFREAKTDVAFVWQDGAILFTAIAALVAEVPRIVLNFRGYPPNLRPHLFKPEYYEFYKSLAEIPQVSFVTNTKVVAEAYCEWLNISNKKFTVVYNGVVAPAVSPESQEELAWAHFESLTTDATETVGGVFRFETDKRPFLVIRFIKRYLQKHPLARFILVGEGRMREQCIDLAKELGVSQRVLFIGLSKSVGYWMLKMDAMILMSLYEGLPNVLIEAQYMGVPVVSTPAGGASECFIEGETGYILDNLKEPDLYEACNKVAMIIDQFRNNPSLKNKAQYFASSNFSISGMIENTVKTLAKTNTNFQLEQLECKELV